MSNIFAYTAPGGNYPEYISVNVDDKQQVTVTVRSPEAGRGECGDSASISLSSEQLQKLASTLFSFACTNKA